MKYGYFFLLVFFVKTSVQAATWTVTNTLASGDGSLDWAITQANSDSEDAKLVTFNIEGTSPFTIYLTNALNITADNVWVCGTNQPGYVDKPVIAIDGGFLSGTNCFNVFGTNNIIQGLVINNCTSSVPGGGIYLGGDYNKVYGCFLGTDFSGQSASGNIYGVIIQSGSFNQVGGTNGWDRNIISGNLRDGMDIVDSSFSNVVWGNYIGVDVTGTNDLGNGEDGLGLYDSSFNQIGGSLTNQGNVISGNGVYGLFVYTNSAYNQISGNRFGTDVNGAKAIANMLGVYLDGANYNQIGGTNFLDKNIISGNSSDGMQLSDGMGNIIYGNYIGLDSTGTNMLSNGSAGIDIYGCSYTQIGGAREGERNIISGHTGSFDTAIALYYGHDNYVQGNFIGTDVSGKLNRGNSVGIRLYGGSSNNYVGGTAAGEGNLIAGNSTYGLWLYAPSFLGDVPENNFVYGNHIGTDVDGVYAITNGVGIQVTKGRNNYIGGASNGMRNIISGNKNYGLHLSNAVANVIMGNFIGTDAAGTSSIYNSAGIYMHNSASNRIGGILGSAGNVISGNNGIGIYLYSTGTYENVIEGNYIGTDASGSRALSNSSYGVYVVDAPKNQIGGSRDDLKGNIICANSSGIALSGDNSSSSSIHGNFIGLDISGKIPLSNRFYGVVANGVNNLTIGGTNQGDGNVISGHSYGIYSSFATNLHICGNYLGLDGDGVTNVGNRYGIYLDTVQNVLIGGSNACERNTISGSTLYGIYFRGSSTASNLYIINNYIGTDASGSYAVSNYYGIRTYADRVCFLNNIISGNYIGINPIGDNNIIQGNRIGTDASGQQAIPNFDGIMFSTASKNNLIGGNTTEERNIISGNHTGLSLGESNNVMGNFIGTDVGGTSALPNKIGVSLSRATHSVIGGTNSGEGNIISGNTSYGIRIFYTTNSVVVGNNIGTDINNQPLPNELGVELYESPQNKIGGVDAGEANTIAWNYTEGILLRKVSTPNSTTNNFLGVNYIYENGGLGIDLSTNSSGDGFTTNDPGDFDAGANGLQNFPVLTNTYSSTTNIFIEGYLDSVTGLLYRLDFYANQNCDPSGYGEGEQWLGATTVDLTATNIVEFYFTSTNVHSKWTYVTALAADLTYSNSSEFSACYSITHEDSDADGIADAWELENFNDDLTVADAASDNDGDGALDVDEYNAYTDPLDASAYLSILSMQQASETNALDIVLDSTTRNREYVLQEITNIVDGTWADAMTSRGEESTTDISVTNFTADVNIYRVQAVQP